MVDGDEDWDFKKCSSALYSRKVNSKHLCVKIILVLLMRGGCSCSCVVVVVVLLS